ncbi:MAG: hypothetical protein AAF447_15300, partial [Myxococcota bacterium]
VLRARPLATSRGARGPRPVRGQTARVWIRRESVDARSAAQGGPESIVLRAETPASEGWLTAVAVPLDQRDAARGAFAPFANVRVGTFTAARAATELARRASPDSLASTAYVAGVMTPVPAPTDAAGRGLLRDPWRARDRFVSGRLALVFRALEHAVQAAAPERLERLAVQRGARWRFRAEALATLASGALGAEGATGLGGEPLDVGRLEALDASFDFDAVARRVTRRRLFDALRAIRDYVRGRQLDLPWARPGDPTLWLAALVRDGALSGRQLVDGWGRELRLRATARPRYAGLQPVPGYELVSAGPDGRFASGDDMADPTARVLPSGSLYAEAVGEDALVARLQGVSLGRVSVETAGQIFGAGRPLIRAPESVRAAANLGTVPSRHDPPADPLGLRRPARPGAAVLARGAGDAALRLPVGAEPRSWAVLSWMQVPGRPARLREATVRAGAPLLLSGMRRGAARRVLPRRLRVGEEVSVPLTVTNVSEGALRLTLAFESDQAWLEGAFASGNAASGSGSVASTLEVPAGESRDVPLGLRAERAGRVRARVEVRGEGAELLRRSESVAVDRGLHPLRLRRAGLAEAGATWRGSLSVPPDAEDPRGRVVALAGHALALDPDLAPLRRTDPALLAWSESMAGRDVSPGLLASLLRRQDGGGLVGGADPGLATAAALFALTRASATTGDGRVGPARQRAQNRLGSLPPPAAEGRDASRALIARQAALLVALGAGGVDEGLGEGGPVIPYEAADATRVLMPPRPSSGSVRSFLVRQLPALRRMLREAPSDGGLLARAAAALLVASPGDGHGQAMLERALAEHTEPAAEGRRVRGDTPRERFIATCALALAAHRAGRSEEAMALLRGAAFQAPDLVRAGGPATFWWLAAGAYGVFGATPEAQARAAVAATEAGVDGVAVATAAADAGRRFAGAVEVSGGSRGAVGALYVRSEVVYGRPFVAQEGPFTLTLRSARGAEEGEETVPLGLPLAFELAVQARRAVAHPVVELALPVGAEATEELLAALRRLPVVRHAERRAPGFLRLELTPLGEEVEALVPLPLHFAVRGTVRGLAMSAYDRDAPAERTVGTGRTLRVE